jgi:hypothetical protein
MIVVHPATTAAMTADSPTVPVPNTAMLVPGRRSQRVEDGAGARLDPAPERRDDVERRRRVELGHVASVAIAWVAKLDWLKKCECTVSPAQRSAQLPSAREAPKFRPQKSWHTHGRSTWQFGHPPHEP